MATNEYEGADFAMLLKQYYMRFFPFSPMYRWLSYGDDGYFEKREFSMAMGDVYIRYESYVNDRQFKDAIVSRSPDKIDIGAIFSHPPKLKNSVSHAAFQACEKELVFDIDMTDYDEVRTCCSGADICKKCWVFMTIAIKVLDKSLRDEFGFEHILWVYSGRRGVHCWVCDERARHYTNEARANIATYLQIMSGGGDGDDANKRIFINLDHPSSVAHFRETLEPWFMEHVLTEQGWFDTPERWKKIVDMVPDGNVREKLSTSLQSHVKDSVESKWDAFKKIVLSAGTLKEVKKSVMEIVFAFTYPRLDINVSKQVNHLLKSPFCVHPKTGRVCVPIDATKAEDFDPLVVPTIPLLLKQHDEFEKSGKQLPADSPEYDKTELKTTMAIFEAFLAPMEAEVKIKRREQAQQRVVRRKVDDVVDMEDIV